MQFDFDQITAGKGTHRAKWDAMDRAFGITAEDAIPMWIADMDFVAPQPVRDALIDEIERGVFGYYDSDASWRQAQVDWLSRRHNWKPEPEWLTTAPGIVVALTAVVRRYSRPGDKVILFSPVYHEFAKAIAANDREIHNHPMIEEQGRYSMDIAGLAANLPERARVVILCSPHNPSGRVWSKEELNEVADFCVANDLILISDEIHYDLVYSGKRHVPTAVAAPQVVDRLVTLVGPTKTFNIAGAKIGAAITSNPELKRELDAELRAVVGGSGNRFGMVATEAALREGDQWLDALLVYLEANRDHFEGEIARAIPGTRPMNLESTYLEWIDFAGTGLAREDFMDRIQNRARIAVSPGPPFGPGGEQRVRFNIATQRAQIDEALERLAEAFSDLK